jgi:hypothetical protein
MIEIDNVAYYDINVEILSKKEFYKFSCNIHEVEYDCAGFVTALTLKPSSGVSTICIDGIELLCEDAKYILQERIVKETNPNKKADYESTLLMASLGLIQDEMNKNNFNYFVGKSVFLPFLGEQDIKIIE